MLVRRSARGSTAACVDSRFRVHGTRGLRVVDASVFPRIPGFFIASAVYMIAEKAADAILQDARCQPARRPTRIDAAATCPHCQLVRIRKGEIHGLRRRQLLEMTQAQLDDLFRASPAGPDPERRGGGHGDHRAGHQVHRADRARSSTTSRWQGKVFDAESKLLKNRIRALGFEAIIASVYKGPSWIDSKDCVVLDYSQTSLLAHWIRDEIRLVSPGLLPRQGVLGQGSPDRLLPAVLSRRRAMTPPGHFMVVAPSRGRATRRPLRDAARSR